MPLKLKTPCNHIGCTRTVRGRYCDEHKQETRKLSEDRRGTAAQRGYDADWKKLRDWYVRQHPLCEDCLEEGIVNGKSIEVDHVIPIDVKPELRLDANNLRSRCRRHHRLKTARDKKKYGKN